MLGRILAVAATSLGLVCAVAFAESNEVTQGQATDQLPLPGQSATAEQVAQNMSHQIRDELQKQGFSDVKVAPGAYVVSAKNKNGEPVTMIIGPESMTMFTLEKDAPQQAEVPTIKE